MAKAATALTEKDIQRAIMIKICGGGDTFINNFTPVEWWENDVIRITPAGYWYEYEVKLSMSDFRADKRKKQNVLKDFPYPGTSGKTYRSWTNEMEFKHKLLAGDSGRGPKQFWFVCPDEVIQPEQVPEWAGLMWASKDEYGRMWAICKRQAPNRKTKKQSDKIVERIQFRGFKRYTYKLMFGKDAEAEVDETEHYG